MSLNNGEQRPCNRCGKRIIGADMGSPGSEPIEAEPSPDGTVLIQRQQPGVAAVAFVKTLADELRALGVELRHNHSTRCPGTNTPSTEGTGT